MSRIIYEKRSRSYGSGGKKKSPADAGLLLYSEQGDTFLSRVLFCWRQSVFLSSCQSLIADSPFSCFHQMLH